jgi:Phage capsid family
MQTIYDLIATEEARLESVREKKRYAKSCVEDVINASERNNNGYVTRADEVRTNAMFKDIENYRAAEKRIQARLGRMEQVREEEEEYDRNLRGTPIPANLPNTRTDSRQIATVSVTREARTYNPGTDRTGGQFIKDLVADFAEHGRARNGASERISRHVEEERVHNPHLVERGSGVGTGAFSGLTVPQYLTDMVAPSVSNLRPYANLATSHPLPESGMSVNISRITTPSSTALQASELNAVSWTDMDDTLLTLSVLTNAGQQLVSRQALDRSTGVEDTILNDLFRSYAVTLDNTMLNQTTTGATNVAGTVTYTDASPTQENLYPYLFQAQSTLETTLRGVAVPNAVVMHPRRWNWLSSKLTTSWPLINNGQGSGYQSGQVTSLNYAGGQRGVLPNGLAVYTDANIATNKGGGTNQDEIYLISTDEVHLWESPDAPVMIRAEQPQVQNLGVVLVIYGYFAYTTSRYSSNPVKISGTGLVAPTGF